MGLQGHTNPVAAIFENLEDGLTIDDVMKQFPVTREQVTAVLEFAARNLDAPGGAQKRRLAEAGAAGFEVFVTTGRNLTYQALASDASLEAAFTWLCARRADWPDHADVWPLRVQWAAERVRSKMTCVTAGTSSRRSSGSRRRRRGAASVGTARDALVLKALTTVLAGVLPRSPRCVHLVGHGGAKAAVRAAWEQLAAHRFVLKTDVKRFYESIDVEVLLTQLAPHIPDRGLLDLLARALHQTITWRPVWGRPCGRREGPTVARKDVSERGSRTS